VQEIFRILRTIIRNESVSVAILILVFLCFRFTALGLAMRAAARNPVSSRLVGIRVGRMLAFGWGLAAAIGAVAGIMAAPIVYLDPDMMSGIQEIIDRTNDSSLVTLQAPLHPSVKAMP
jgi:branched-subunit amino acid ABC-type transport system permease component